MVGTFADGAGFPVGLILTVGASLWAWWRHDGPTAAADDRPYDWAIEEML